MLKCNQYKLCSKMQSSEIYNLSKGKGVDMDVEKHRRKHQRHRRLFDRLSVIWVKLLNIELDLEMKGGKKDGK